MGSEAVIATPVIKIAAICGSLRKGSFNRGLIRSAIEISKESISGMQIEYVDISPLPMLNTDLEVDGEFPAAVEVFRQKILDADAFLFASPEYNYSVTGPLKNAIDWASRSPNVWADKAAAIVSAAGSLGGARGQYHLRQIGVYLDLHFINKPEFFLNAFESPAKFDSNGNLIDADTKERLKVVLLALQAYALRLKGCSSGFLTMPESPLRISGGTTEDRSSRPHNSDYLVQRSNLLSNYKVGASSESIDWYNCEKLNQGRRGVCVCVWKVKQREMMYKIALAGSWILLVIVLVLFWARNDGNASCCITRNGYYKYNNNLNLGLL